MASALPVRSSPGLAHHAVVPVTHMPCLKQSPNLSSYLFPTAHRGLGQTLEPVLWVSDVEVLKVERIQLIDAVLNLCTYHHPENIQLPPG